MLDNNKNILDKKNQYINVWWLLIIYAVLFIVSLGIGRYQISPVNVVKILFSKMMFIPQTWNDTMEMIVISVRLPRLIAATLVGSSLALAGVCFQGLFKNPLVSPDILGVSSGAGFGAAIALILGLGAVGIQLSALIFSLVAVTLAYLVKTIYKSQNVLILVLSGVIISGFFSSALSFLKYIADPIEILPAIVFWLMGSIATTEYSDIFMVLIPIVGCSAILLFIRWRFNILSLGDVEAKSLGINVKKMQKVIILCATVITASSVCISGTIGWIGLVVPHLAKLLVGTNHSKLLPASCVLGAIMLVFLDNIARTMSSAEIPLGIVTGLIGTPVFAFLLFKQRTNVV